MAAEGTMASYMVDLPEGSAAAKRSGVQTEPASPIQAKPVSHATSLRGTVFAPALYQYIHDVIDGKSFFDPYAADASWMRAILAIGAVQSYFHEEKTRDAVSLVKELRDVPVDLDELGLCDARIRSFFEECIRCLETDTAVNTLDRVAGADEELSRSVQSIPTMASQETLRYYKWLARTLEHPGDIVELGSWMGSTTACLAEGLSQNLCRKHTRIHAYDSFIWRDWMRTYTEDPELPGCKHSRRGLISRLFPPLYGTFAPPDRRASISIEDSDPADRLRQSNGVRADRNPGDGFRSRPSFERGDLARVQPEFSKRKHDRDLQPVWKYPGRRRSRILSRQGGRARPAAQTPQFREGL
jgi:hypothetical protein